MRRKLRQEAFLFIGHGCDDIAINGTMGHARKKTCEKIWRKEIKFVNLQRKWLKAVLELS